VQRCGSDQHVERDPPGVEQSSSVVAAVEKQPTVRGIGAQERDERDGEDVPADATVRAAEHDAGAHRQEQEIHHGVGQRRHLGRQREAAVVRVRRHEEDPRQRSDADRDRERIDQRAPVAHRIARPHEHRQPHHQARVHGEVDRIGDRRERQLAAE
jgi:hypothetical protein